MSDAWAKVRLADSASTLIGNDLDQHVSALAAKPLIWTSRILNRLLYAAAKAMEIGGGLACATQYTSLTLGLEWGIARGVADSAFDHAANHFTFIGGFPVA